MLIISGKSGSGKTELAKGLTKMGYFKTLTATTRPQRQNESVFDYIFCTDREFENFDMMCVMEYRGYKYGAAKPNKNLSTDFIILDPTGAKEGLQTYLNEGIPCKILYLTISPNIALKRLQQRGLSQEDIEKQIAYDSDFDAIINTIDPNHVVIARNDNHIEYMKNMNIADNLIKEMKGVK